ncbi:MAG: DUF3696 domain-containing protein [Proteobacteria bacterium]|nr:DUF3696 domain-containing protein [Pseudomonadota bacterium]MDA1254760.1 DUF3696 domain-containing protein [Pseudomonadota bacterium]
MIEKISVSNFKSLKNCEINLKLLSVFSGINGSGKSSLTQAVFLIKSLENYSYFKSISLNNEFQNLGNVKDVLFEGAEDDKICINLKFDKMDFKSELLVDNYELDYTKLKTNIGNKKNTLKECLSKLSLLKADRLGPVIVQEKNDLIVKNKKSIGLKGEYIYSFLEIFGNDKIDSADYRVHLLATSNQLIELVRCWMGEICPEISMHTSSLEGTDFVSLRYSFKKNNYGKSNLYRATNVGFGISYVLPVVVLLIMAQPGETIFIDTPEAHLHPRGQVKLGELISKTASDGVQVVVETHSDHIINGIRKSVILGNLEPNNTAFFYFSIDKNNDDLVFSTKVEEPKLNFNGKFDYWPDGFFDEWGKTLEQLLLAKTKD